RKVVIDLAIGEIATFLTQLDEHFQTIATRFLLFGRQAACGYIFLALSALCSPLGQRLQFGDDLAAVNDIVDEIISSLVRILGWTARTTPGGLGRPYGRRFLGRRFLGSSFLHRRLLGGSLLYRCLLGSGLFGGCFTCGTTALNVFPDLDRERIHIAGRCYSFGFDRDFVSHF